MCPWCRYEPWGFVAEELLKPYGNPFQAVWSCLVFCRARVSWRSLYQRLCILTSETFLLPCVLALTSDMNLGVMWLGMFLNPTCILHGMICVFTCVHADPYLNTDAGTMSPFEHGEVFVLDDGGEVRPISSNVPCSLNWLGHCRLLWDLWNRIWQLHALFTFQILSMFPLCWRPLLLAALCR